jgi:chromosome segregation ATPase
MTNSEETLANELNNAKAELEALRSEQQQLGSEQARFSDPDHFDAGALLELQRRADDLPMRVLAAEGRLLAISVRVREGKLPALLANEEEAAQKLEKVRQRLERAQSEFAAATNAFYAAHQARQTAQFDLADTRRALEAKIGQLRKPLSPIVRSLRHASSNAA